MPELSSQAPTQSTPTQLPEAQPTPQPSKHFPRPLILGLLLIILALSVTLAYLLFTQFLSEPSNPPTETSSVPIDVTTETTTPDPTADWQTYSTDTFSFKYPNGHISYQRPNSESTMFLPTESYEGCKSANESKNPSFQDFDPCSQSLFSFSRLRLVPFQEYQTSQSPAINPEQKTTSITDYLNREWTITYEYGQVFNIIASTIIDENVAELSFQYGFSSYDENVIIPFISQILSTFQFTNEESSISTTDWQTYNNMGYSFKYPSQYKIEERDPGYLVITLANEQTPQAGISIDSRLTGSLNNLELAEKYIQENFETLSTTQNNTWTIYKLIGRGGLLEKQQMTYALSPYKTGVISAEVFSNSDYAKLFDQILSTFEFTE